MILDVHFVRKRTQRGRGGDLVPGVDETGEGLRKDEMLRECARKHLHIQLTGSVHPTYMIPMYIENKLALLYN